MEKLLITPKTKIYDLLEAYPQLEDVLISLAPEFKKLKNPVLRRTIARVASVSQAAIIGGLNVEHMVNTLRAKVGQDHLSQIDETGTKYNTEQPTWYHAEKIIETINVSEMLNRGEQPVHEVMSSVKKLKEDEIIEVIAPFIPAPLLDKALSVECKHWLKKISDTEYRVYLRK